MSAITYTQNKAMHSLLHQLGLMDQKKDLVEQCTNGRTSSSREMSRDEADYMVRILQAQKKERTGKQIGKIIHLLSLLGYVRADGTPDYTRINTFIRNIGSRNPRGVNLNYLTVQELNQVVTQVEQIYKKESK